MARSHLLDLCQELRDIIYDYVLAEDQEPDDTASVTLEAAQDSAPGEHGWIHHHPSTPATHPTCLALLRTSRQVRAETLTYLARREDNNMAELSLTLKHPNCAATLTRLPSQPQNPHTLHITLSLSNLYAKPTAPPSPAIAAAVWDTLTRYISHGPILSRRPSPLERPLEVERVRVTLLEPAGGDLVFHYGGNPWMQMGSLFSCLRMWVGTFAREAKGGVGRVEARFGRRGWESVFVARAKGGGGEQKVRGVEGMRGDVSGAVCKAVGGAS